MVLWFCGYGEIFPNSNDKDFLLCLLSGVLWFLCLFKMWIYELIFVPGARYDSKFCFLTYGYAPFLAPFFFFLISWTNKLIQTYNEILFSTKKELTTDTHINLD